MNAERFEGVNVTFAKDQPQYRQLPARAVPGDPEGRVVFCWRLTWRERAALLLRGRLWHEVLTFGRPLQPQRLGAGRPDMLKVRAVEDV